MSSSSPPPTNPPIPSGSERQQKKSFASMTDKDFKETGNKYFSSRKFEEAIQCYSNAIIRNPSNPIYYTNRALAELKINRFDDVVADSRAALELDPLHMKGHFFLGQALCELNLMDDGVKHLQRAVDIAREQRLNYGDEMTQILRQWRKKRFSLQEEKRLAQELELQTYLAKLISEDRERKVEEIKQKFAGEGDTPQAVESIASLEKYSDQCMTEMNNLFAKVDERRRKREVPDFLCGKISFEILRDPVVTPSGITYERKDIEDHLMRVGHFDPVTRVALTADQLIPNYVMKEVVDAFISENEWALDF